MRFYGIQGHPWALLEGSKLILNITTSLFHSAVYQRQTKGLKVYNQLNKFATALAASTRVQSLGQGSPCDDGLDDLRIKLLWHG